MRISILTICPEQFGDFKRTPLIARTIENKILELEIIDIREFADGCFRKVDDSPYGGGAGMVLRCQPVLDALDSVRTMRSHTVVLAPVGKTFTQKDSHRLSEKEHLILICGHYEGMDARIYEHADELFSIGDYVLTGGELPAMVISDSVMRLVKGAIKEESIQEESFENGLLEYPQYTRPADYKGQKVPEILLSGNHEAIRKWRGEEALRLTKKFRPDLLQTDDNKRSGD
ncbi:MAG: tRNA (guanosine(37)-N1)-methyltransferase TrmD [Parasporobacterium sp.]|nr:tRNA (guanosine(37)-N1)-methyltransferase TrmD [Parasporobacterium sp.]